MQHYKCVLCPVDYTEYDFVEQPKLTHHKKKMSEKDRERERQDVQKARKAAEFYRKKQEEMNRPVNPREPLKRTADNNWVHATCAVWTPEVKFGNAKALEPSEGIPSIPRSKYDEVCQVCNKKDGACVSCHQCRIPSKYSTCSKQMASMLTRHVSACGMRTAAGTRSRLRHYSREKFPSGPSHDCDNRRREWHNVGDRLVQGPCSSEDDGSSYARYCQRVGAQCSAALRPKL